MASRLDRDDIPPPGEGEEIHRVIEHPKAKLVASKGRQTARVKVPKSPEIKHIRYFEALQRIIEAFINKGHPNHALIAIAMMLVAAVVIFAIVADASPKALSSLSALSKSIF